MTQLHTKKSDFLQESYQVFHHESGLDVYVIPKKMRVSYAIFATRYGSVDNTFKLSGDEAFTTVPDGIAHYLEHKMFENPDGEDTFLRYAKYGANANAFTSNTMTAYLFSCTSHFDESLETLLNMVTTPYFTPETVEKERGIIGQEIRMYEDNPFSKLYQQLLEGLYENNTIRINIAGTVESISRITADILQDCYRVFYNLSNMALVVCGDVTVQQVSDVCDRVLKKQEAVQIVRQEQEEPRAVYKPYQACRMEVAKPLFALGVKDNDIPGDPKLRIKKQAAATILDQVLFGKSSAFYNRLYDAGLINDQFGVSYEIEKRYAFHVIFGESDAPQTVVEEIKKYLDDMIQSGLPTEDFERSKRSLYASNVRLFDSTENIAEYMTAFIFDGGDLFDFVEALSEITLEDVTDMLKASYIPENYALSVVEPLKKENE